MADVSTYKPGQVLHLTVSKLPRSHGDTQTMLRLMRLDPTAKKALRTAQRMRSQRQIVYNRGNRDWVSREKSARVVRVELGRAWSLPFTLNYIPDLKAIADYVSIKA